VGVTLPRGSCQVFHNILVLQENLTLEVCLAKYWSNLGHTDVEYSIQFHGVTVSGGPVVIVSDFSL